MSKNIRNIVIGVCGCILAYVIFVAVTGIKIPCFYLSNFGVECPGCGVTRMFVSMLHLDFVSAFWFNPVMFVLFFLWLAIGLLCFLSPIKLFKNKTFLKWTAIVSLVIAGSYGIIRNFY